jgi:hypothetical protein
LRRRLGLWHLPVFDAVILQINSQPTPLLWAPPAGGWVPPANVPIDDNQQIPIDDNANLPVD